MAMTIKIKSSNTSAAPVSLAAGELAYSYVSNQLFVGNAAGNAVRVLIPETFVRTINGAAPDANGNLDVSLSNLSDFVGAPPATGQSLVFDGTKFVARALTAADISDFEAAVEALIPAPTVVSVNGQEGDVELALSDLTDVDLSAPVAGQVLMYGTTAVASVGGYKYTFAAPALPITRSTVFSRIYASASDELRFDNANQPGTDGTGYLNIPFPPDPATWGDIVDAYNNNATFALYAIATLEPTGLVLTSRLTGANSRIQKRENPPANGWTVSSQIAGHAEFTNSTGGDPGWVAGAIPSAPVSSVNGQTGAVVLATTDLADFNTAVDARATTVADARIAAADLGDLADVNVAGATDGQFLSLVAGEWTAVTPTDIVGATKMDELTDVNVTTLANGDVLVYDSTNEEWVSQAIPSAPVSSVNGKTGAVVIEAADIADLTTAVFEVIGTAELGDLSDVDATTPATTGQVLTYNGTDWAPATPTAAPVDSVNGQTGVVVLDTTDLADFDTAVDARAATVADARIAAADLADLANVADTPATNGQVLVYDTGTGLWTPQTSPEGVTELSQLSDVDVAGATEGQVLTYNETSEQWEAVSLPAAPVTSVNGQTGVVALALDDISDVNTAGAVDGDFLVFQSGEWTATDEINGGTF